MAKNKENFYIAKGEKDVYPWLYYGEEPPVITDRGDSTDSRSKCILIGPFNNNIIGNSIKDNEIVKIYIRTVTIKK